MAGPERGCPRGLRSQVHLQLLGKTFLSPTSCVVCSQAWDQYWRCSHIPYLRDPSRGPGLPGQSPQTQTGYSTMLPPPASELRSESPPGVGGPALSCLHPQANIFGLCPSQRTLTVTTKWKTNKQISRLKQEIYFSELFKTEE